MLLTLQGCVKPYAWGSRTAIPELFGWEASGEPLAEFWLGAHPAGPSTVNVDGVELPLDVVLASTPQLRCGDGLPFLMKVLAADQVLSLQVHPGADQAAAGFAAEEAAGVPLDAPARRYKDVNAKDEMVVALGPFRALAGIRDPALTLRVVDAIGHLALTSAFDPLRADPRAEGVLATLRGLLQLPRAEAAMLVDDVVGACAALDPAEDAAVADWVTLLPLLTAAHPGDVGALAALLLNDVALDSGQALFQPARSLHAYVSGLAVEVMVSSDNVLRAGLTDKHVDVDELLAVVDVTPARPVRHDLVGPMASWRTPSGDFSVHQIRPDGGSAHPDVSGPAVILATAGELLVSADGVSQRLVPGQAVLAPSSVGLDISGSGTCYVAAGGRVEARIPKPSTGTDPIPS